jgi:hypothetical protein
MFGRFWDLDGNSHSAGFITIRFAEFDADHAMLKVLGELNASCPKLNEQLSDTLL